MPNPLPHIIAKLTRTQRYAPRFEWVESCWTHNLFRLFELAVGRKVGIRPESTVIVQDGVEYHYVHSFEAAVARLETMARSALTRQWVPPIRVYVPVLQTPQGIPMPASPFLFAIAFGNVTQDVDASTSTLSFTSPTVSGSDTYGWLAVYGVRASALGSPTWNGSSMTIAGSVQPAEANRQLGLYRIIAPATGTVTTTVTSSGSPTSVIGIATFYTGAAQQAPEDADGTTAGSASSVSDDTTVTTNNGWVVGCGCETGGPGTVAVSTGVTQRGTTGSADSGDSSMAFGDSNGGQAPGNYSMTFTAGAGSNMAICMAAFAPAAAAAVSAPDARIFFI